MPVVKDAFTLAPVEPPRDWGITLGPRCETCHKTEARCAYDHCCCCPECSHTFGELDQGTRYITRTCTDCDQPFTLVRRTGRPKTRCGQCRLSTLVAA